MCKGQTVDTLVPTHNLSSFQHIAFIFQSQMQDGERMIIMHFGFPMLMSKTELCHHFDSDKITLT